MSVIGGSVGQQARPPPFCPARSDSSKSCRPGASWAIDDDGSEVGALVAVALLVVEEVAGVAAAAVVLILLPSIEVFAEFTVVEVLVAAATFLSSGASCCDDDPPPFGVGGAEGVGAPDVVVACCSAPAPCC